MHEISFNFNRRKSLIGHVLPISWMATRKEETKGNQQTSKNKARQHECLWNVRNVIVALKECIVILRNFFKLTSIFLERTLFSSSLSASSNSKSSITCVWSKSISQKTCFCIASQLKILRIPQAILITPFSELPLPWSFDVISRLKWNLSS